jgi:ATP-dependent DNA helicase RecG
MHITAGSDITTVKGVGDKLKRVFSNLDIETVNDLVKHIPFRYRDTREIFTISQFKEQGEGTFLGQIVDTKNIYTRTGKKLTKVRVADNEDKIDLTFFNQTYLTKVLRTGDWYIFDGKISNKNGKNVFNPKYEKYEGDTDLQTNLGKIYGIYHETKGITSRNIRKILDNIKDEISNLYSEYLPKEILEKEKLIPITEALVQIHFPDSKDSLELARERLSFDEMLRVALKIEKQAMERDKQVSRPIEKDYQLHK